MLLLRTLAPLLFVAILGHQVSPSSGERRGKWAETTERTVTAAPARAQRTGAKPAANGRGKFNFTEKEWNDEEVHMQCSWAAKDVAGAVKLSVKCENPEARIKGGVTDLECDYEGKPQRCPGYQTDPRGFWKQVARAFKKLQGKVCKDERVRVKAGMCKRAPRDAHFKLDIGSSRSSAQSGGLDMPPTTPTACAGRDNARKRAEQHCSSSWASVCAFFFEILQSDDC